MTASEIAETLINGNISDAREALKKRRTGVATAILALDVAYELSYVSGEYTCDAAIARVKYLLA